MKKLLLTILFINQLAFSQAEKNDYQLYSLILSEQLDLGKKSNVDSIILIEKFESKSADFFENFDSKSDSISNSDMNFLSINTGNDTIFIKRLIKETEFRKSVFGLTSDFGLSPKINGNLLSTDQLNIQSITS